MNYSKRKEKHWTSLFKKVNTKLTPDLLLESRLMMKTSS